MINPSEHNKKDDDEPQDRQQKPDSTTAICDILILKLKEKEDEPNKPKRPAQDEPVEILDSDDSDTEKDEYESGSSAATSSQIPIKQPRAFERSDHLYGQKMEKKKERARQVEDWIWRAEHAQPERRFPQDSVIQKKK